MFFVLIFHLFVPFHTPALFTSVSLVTSCCFLHCFTVAYELSVPSSATVSLHGVSAALKCFQGSAVDGADISRNIRAIDRAALKTELTARLSHLPCPIADDLDSVLTGVLDAYAPVMRRRVRPQKNAPWFSGVAGEVRSLKQQRRRAERLWLKTGLTVHKQLYNNAKKKQKTCNQTSSQSQNYLLL